MAADNDPPTPGALDVIRGALAAAGFAEAEGAALLDQALAARAPAPAAPAPRPGTTSTAAGAAAAKSYTLDEIRELGRALGLGGAAAPVASAAAAAPAGPPITSRAAPPPAGKPTDATPIYAMGEADRRALAAEIGDVKFAERMLKEFARDRIKVRPRGGLV